ncbi:PRC-barrel domain-containing protein [Streptomyces sp. NPDC028635]|uniref:PRC-barrel domain-containing protein n=1 Tax=Streptomyces sp. NPDC028635 TaxID=3154800 RepID=UPI0033F8D124
MSTLLLASELTGRVVVTLGGEALAKVKDTVFDAPAGRVIGFTLNGRGLLAGPLRRSLPFAGVHAVGPSAVMVRDETALVERRAVIGSGEAAHGDVLGAPVLTDQGTEVGTVLDLVVASGAGGRVVGFEIAAHARLERRQRKVFIPRGQTLAVSGQALVVPTSARHFLADDLPHFAAQVEAFQVRSRQGSADTVTPGEDTGGRG